MHIAPPRASTSAISLVVTFTSSRPPRKTFACSFTKICIVRYSRVLCVFEIEEPKITNYNNCPKLDRAARSRKVWPLAWKSRN